MAPGLDDLLRRLKRIGEPWTFGFKPEDLPAYLENKGMRRCVDLGAGEYRGLYLPNPGRRQEGYEFYRVALAEPL